MPSLPAINAWFLVCKSTKKAGLETCNEGIAAVEGAEFGCCCSGFFSQPETQKKQAIMNANCIDAIKYLYAIRFIQYESVFFIGDKMHEPLHFVAAGEYGSNWFLMLGMEKTTAGGRDFIL